MIAPSGAPPDERAPGGAAIPRFVSAIDDEDEAGVSPATVVDGWPRAIVSCDAVFDGDAVVELAVPTEGREPAASGAITAVVAAGAIADGVPPECGTVVRETVGRTVVGVGCGTQIAAALAGARGGLSVECPFPSN